MFGLIFLMAVVLIRPAAAFLMPRGAGQFSLKDTKIAKEYYQDLYPLFYANHIGEPAGLKSTNKIRLEEAWDQWNLLQEHGWTEVSHNFG